MKHAARNSGGGGGGGGGGLNGNAGSELKALDNGGLTATDNGAASANDRVGRGNFRGNLVSDSESKLRILPGFFHVNLAAADTDIMTCRATKGTLGAWVTVVGSNILIAYLLGCSISHCER
jgi:hypothetical protein